MVLRFLADLVLVAHLAFIVFVAFGGLLTLWWRWIPALQIPAALWGVCVEVFGVICPLTPLENALRRSAGDAGYTGGFVEQYLVPLIYPSFLSWPVQIVLAATVVLLNVGIYFFVWRSGRRRRGNVRGR